MYVSTFTITALAAVISLPFSFAQVTTSCQPLNGSCPPELGLATSSYFIDFTKVSSLPADWTVAAYENVSFGPNGAELTFAKRYDAPLIRTNFNFLFGRVDYVVQTAPGVGIASCMVLLSSDLDEIDWELLGGAGNSAETNYWGKGQIDYSVARYVGVNSPTTQFHTYSVDWSPASLSWIIDGKIVRTVSAAEGGNIYPQTPMKVSLSVWDGGDPSEPAGTRTWAGGNTPIPPPENYTMFIKSVSIKNTNPAEQFEYTDRSGSWQSIKMLNDTAFPASQNSSQSLRPTSISANPSAPFILPTNTPTSTIVAIQSPSTTLTSQPNSATLFALGNTKAVSQQSVAMSTFRSATPSVSSASPANPGPLINLTFTGALHPGMTPSNSSTFVHNGTYFNSLPSSSSAPIMGSHAPAASASAISSHTASASATPMSSHLYMSLSSPSTSPIMPFSSVASAKVAGSLSPMSLLSLALLISSASLVSSTSLTSSLSLLSSTASIIPSIPTSNAKATASLSAPTTLLSSMASMASSVSAIINTKGTITPLTWISSSLVPVPTVTPLTSISGSLVPVPLSSSRSSSPIALSSKAVPTSATLQDKITEVSNTTIASISGSAVLPPSVTPMTLISGSLVPIPIPTSLSTQATITTQIVHSTTTLCPITSTITSNGTPVTKVTTMVSTILSTSTSVICSKCIAPVQSNASQNATGLSSAPLAVSPTVPESSGSLASSITSRTSISNICTNCVGSTTIAASSARNTASSMITPPASVISESQLAMSIAMSDTEKAISESQKAISTLLQALTVASADASIASHLVYYSSQLDVIANPTATDKPTGSSVQISYITQIKTQAAAASTTINTAIIPAGIFTPIVHSEASAGISAPLFGAFTSSITVELTSTLTSYQVQPSSTGLMLSGSNDSVAKPMPPAFHGAASHIFASSGVLSLLIAAVGVVRFLS